MSRTIEDVIADLNSLKPRDFNLQYADANGLERLAPLTVELAALAKPDNATEVLFGFIERMSATDEIDPRHDLGTPGPLVHTLEELPNYQKKLAISINRYPTPLTIWMVNRILNATKAQQERAFWLQLLLDCLKHPLLTPLARLEAEDFIKFQKKLD